MGIGLSVALSGPVTFLADVQGVSSDPDQAFMKLDCFLRDDSLAMDGIHGSHAETWMLIMAITLIPAAMIMSLIAIVVHRYIKKDYMVYLKDYMKKVVKYLEENDRA